MPDIPSAPAVSAEKLHHLIDQLERSRTRIICPTEHVRATVAAELGRRMIAGWFEVYVDEMCPRGYVYVIPPVKPTIPPRPIQARPPVHVRPSSMIVTGVC